MRFSLVLGTGLLASSMAYGQGVQNVAYQADMESQKTATALAERDVSIELMPAVTLASAVPGVGAAGLSVESEIDQKWAGFVTGSYADGSLDQRWTATGEDLTNEPTPTAGYGFALGGGLRYYEDPVGDSLYGGTSLTYSEQNLDWSYDNADLETASFTTTAALFAGYRWLWNNGALVRLGAGVGMPHVDSLVISASDSADAVEAEDKIADIFSQGLIAKLDLGVGFAF